MSDSESQSTLEDVSFARILEIMDAAAADAIASGDFLSYATVLDIYLGQPARYSYPERETLLRKLLAVFDAHHDLVAAVGWDLPPLLLQYIDSDFNFEAPIRQAPCAYPVFKLFERLALHGNHKELLLKSCEVLSSHLRISDSASVTSDVLLQEKFFDLKVYCVVELVDTCLRRIATEYPSRFLSMAVTSIINMIDNNRSASTGRFILKRVYNFARNYYPAAARGDAADGAEGAAEGSALSAVSPGEIALTRKLLTSFISHAVELVSVEYIAAYSVALVSQLQEPTRGQLPSYFNFEVQNDSMDRMVSLAESFDVDLPAAFERYRTESQALFALDWSQPDDDLTAHVFEAAVRDYQHNVHTAVVDASQRICNSQYGCLLLLTHQMCAARALTEVRLTFHDAVVMTLRTVAPSMVHPRYTSRGMQDVAVFWCWLAIHQDHGGVAAIPPALLTLFLQSLLFVCVSNPASATFRYLLMTLLTRVLSLAPEEVAWQFLRDSVENCPYDNVKVALVGVLRELFTQERPTAKPQPPKAPLTAATAAATEASAATAAATEASAATAAATEAPAAEAPAAEAPAAEAPAATAAATSGAAEAATAGLASLKLAPPLPPRKFLALTPQRADEILALTAATHAAAFAPPNVPKLTHLTALLNLLVVVRSNPAVDAESVAALRTAISRSIAAANPPAATANAVDILSIAIERLQ